jgi:hypothetical protein
MDAMKPEFQFVKVTRSLLLEFIGKTRKRVVIAKPGYSCEEVNLLKKLSEFSTVDCSLYVDPSEEAVRWGFGDKDALNLIQQNLEILHVQTAKRIRLSVVIVADSALIYVPVALSWEEEPSNILYPNGVIGGTDMVVSFLQQISKSNGESKSDNKVIPFPGCEIPSKTIESIRKEIEETQEKLVKNPPVDPAKLRTVTVYRNIYKLVKIEIRGARVKNKSVSLRPINTIFPAASERLKSSWQVFSKDDLADLWQMQMFRDEIQKIIDEFTLNIKRFGFLIKVDDKTEFEKRLKEEKGLLLNVLSVKNNDVKTKDNSKYSIKLEVKQLKLPGLSSPPKAPRTLSELLEDSQRMLIEYFNGFVGGNDSAKQALLNSV